MVQNEEDILNLTRRSLNGRLMVQAGHRNRQVFVDKNREAQPVVVAQHNVPARLQREVSLGVRKLGKDETRAWLFKN